MCIRDRQRQKYAFQYKFGFFNRSGKSRCQGAGFKSQLDAAVALNTCLVEEGIVPQNKGWFMDEEEPERAENWLESWSDAMTRADAAAEASTLAAAVDDAQTETAAAAAAAAASAEKCLARDHAAAQDALAEPEARVRAESARAAFSRRV